MMMPGPKSARRQSFSNHLPSVRKDVLFDGIHGNPFTILSKFFILYSTINLGKKGIITTAANIGTGVNDRTQLPDKDVTGLDALPAKPFHSTPLPCAVAAVT